MAYPVRHLDRVRLDHAPIHSVIARGGDVNYRHERIAFALALLPADARLNFNPTTLEHPINPATLARATPAPATAGLLSRSPASSTSREKALSSRSAAESSKCRSRRTLSLSSTWAATRCKQ